MRLAFIARDNDRFDILSVIATLQSPNAVTQAVCAKRYNVSFSAPLRCMERLITRTHLPTAARKQRYALYSAAGADGALHTATGNIARLGIERCIGRAHDAAMIRRRKRKRCQKLYERF